MFLAPTIGTITEALTGRSWDAAALEGEVRSRMAGYRAHGVQRGDRVMLGFGNRLEFFADLTALWRLGVCVIPLDARFTAFEVETLVRAAKARAFVSCGGVDSTISARLADMGTSELDSLTLATTPHDSEPGLPQFSLEDDALILFTSGTTGNPKGVVHTHRTLRARWLALRDHLGVEAYARTLCLLPTHFGHGLICNALFPWLSGQSLFILPPFTPDVLMRLGAILDEHRITFMSSVPAVWRMALKASRPTAAGTLQRVFVGSAPLSAHLWREIRAWSGAREVANAYGITETGSWVAGTTIPNVEPEDGLVGPPWGAAVAITRSGEIDAPPGIGELCAAGESGFVWLNTPALMKGYMDRDDLTEQCVRGGWFLTGDLGLINDRGWLYLRGRVRDEINKGAPRSILRTWRRSPSRCRVCSTSAALPWTTLITGRMSVWHWCWPTPDRPGSASFTPGCAAIWQSTSFPFAGSCSTRFPEPRAARSIATTSPLRASRWRRSTCGRTCAINGPRRTS
jgi:acyl-CoA synthetase (AMP-forming)/AMP-acid ligase II